MKKGKDNLASHMRIPVGKLGPPRTLWLFLFCFLITRLQIQVHGSQIFEESLYYKKIAEFQKDEQEKANG